ncbi:MAG: UDP-2,3-diacylglucosamine diphosphatase LpxI [Planctomycetaceae bacterium]
MSNSLDTIPFTPAEGRRVGLLAGWGRFPLVFAEAAQQMGLSVRALGISGMADDEALSAVCDSYDTVPLARIGKAIRYFKKQQAPSIVMAGKVEKRVLFHPLRLFRLLPDWRMLRLWYHYCRDNRKDDSLLLAIIREFEKDGLHFDSALNLCPELLVKHGFITHRQPSAAQWRDIRFGWEIAKEMGRLDIGQTVIVHDAAVIAVEAIEGTDECIQRAGSLCRRGGLTVVKVAKPQQDMRFDVPTVGVRTLQTMYEAGARCLAIEADRTILLDEPEVVALAEKLGVAIVALKSEEVRLRVAS